MLWRAGKRRALMKRVGTYISARMAIRVIPSLKSLRDFDGVGKLNVLTLGIILN
jgi:hypothetical protein